jgi:hypothetical protein
VDDDQGASHRWLVVLGTWGMAGAAAGSAIGGLLQGLQGVEGAAAAVGSAGIGVGALLGAVALVTERKGAESRPLLVDARGHGSRPLHGWLFAVPVAVVIPSLWVLGVVATLAVGSFVPLLAFGSTSLVVAWAGLRVWSSHRFTIALEAAEQGDPLLARERLAQLADSWWCSRSARTAARLNLGMMALQAGDAVEALRWLQQVGPEGAAWAGPSRALAWLIEGEPERAQEALAEGMASAGARQVQEQLDAVRVLLVWRTEGPEAARALGERLAGPSATPLHRALLAALRPEAGSLDDEVQALLGSRLAQRLPELHGVG